ncbi:DUF5134 domain-containing protein [Streptomyces thermolilacinus]|uniref:DUF5134 domain-containing protein n=1 Tax=Streptomyces thermolilacinus TaxID=285540 RepID=UPI0003F6772B|nr:DUF5134 domain-containing protein [Streptomyces thermolilacinus]
MAGWLLVALCGVTGLYCLARRRRCEGAGREAVMGLGMAVMGLPPAVFAPPGWWWAVYAAVFGGEAARAVWKLRGGGPRGHHVHHLVGSLTMVYMALPTGGAVQGAHGAHGGGGVPLLTGALLAYQAVWALRAGARLARAPVPTAAPLPAATAIPAPAPPAVPAPAPASAPDLTRRPGKGPGKGPGGRPGEGPARGPGAAPEAVAGCRVVMAVAMLVMLAAMP